MPLRFLLLYFRKGESRKWKAESGKQKVESRKWKAEKLDSQLQLSIFYKIEECDGLVIYGMLCSQLQL